MDTGNGSATGTPTPPEPDIWTIFRALRDARSTFGLRPSHVQTLQAMLSFLRPGHGDTVFASNHEICRRVGGIDERTLRRHIDRFVDLGFMERHDSPNGKRYRVRSSDGHCISYGLSLTPFLERASELLAAAQEMENARRDRIFLRKQILTRLARLEEVDPRNPFPNEARKVLRRKLTIAEYRALLSKTEAVCQAMSTVVDTPETRNLPANDGQTVRHHSRSEKEQIDSDSGHSAELPELRALTSICQEATSFTTNALGTWSDVENHARTLAPMMGIHSSSFDRALNKAGARKASCAIFIMLQLGNRIRDFAAYFHSITLGRRASEFNPAALLARLSQANGAAA
ncbi:replication initiation protein RepC [Cribrihabitans marinus]|uniref:Replication initiation protein RepC n=2 Tax=Cribrihabitans marinus TaxID=1227549 RepID=A0A1H7DWC0_9RHOB|nr:replication initiation protein RepC [Cribrihabitans marinus]